MLALLQGKAKSADIFTPAFVTAVPAAQLARSSPASRRSSARPQSVIAVRADGCAVGQRRHRFRQGRRHLHHRRAGRQAIGPVRHRHAHRRRQPRADHRRPRRAARGARGDRAEDHRRWRENAHQPQRGRTLRHRLGVQALRAGRNRPCGARRRTTLGRCAAADPEIAPIRHRAGLARQCADDAANAGDADDLRQRQQRHRHADRRDGPAEARRHYPCERPQDAGGPDAAAHDAGSDRPENARQRRLARPLSRRKRARAGADTGRTRARRCRCPRSTCPSTPAGRTRSTPSNGSPAPPISHGCWRCWSARRTR